MCLIVYKPKGVRISGDELDDLISSSHQQNPDGFGACWHDGSRIHRVRGLFGPQEQTSLLYELVIESDFAIVIHWRYGTSGGKTVENCHPFRLRDKSLMCHNGILPGRWEGGKSDTRQLSEMLPPDPEEQLAELRLWSEAGGGKFVLMRPSGAVEIVGEDLGHWEGGIWYSCPTYRAARPHWPTGWGADWEDYSTGNLAAADLATLEEIVGRCGWDSVADAVAEMRPY